MDEDYIGNIRNEGDYDNSEDNYEDEFDEEDPFKNEIGAYDRAGIGIDIGNYLGGARNTEGKVDITSGSDRFIFNLDGFCKKLPELGDEKSFFTITQEDLKILLETTKKIVNLKDKNYVAYVLGYLAKNKTPDGLFNKNNLKKIFAIIPKLNGVGGITEPDVIRYARYWDLFLVSN
jgi:hypothetical protein